MELYDVLKAQFQAQQLEKNAESIRLNSPEYRRHQALIAEDIKKVETIFEDTLCDFYMVENIETMLHFQALGYPIAMHAPRFKISRKPETSMERSARFQRFEEKEKAQNPQEET
jgi:hypothetical protein